MSDETADARAGEATAERRESTATTDGRPAERAVTERPVEDATVADELDRMVRLSTLLDESIRLPGGYRIGIDPIVGVLPVVGDVFASAVSVYIVLEAAYQGVPRSTLARMGLYVLVDTVVGSVPVVGPAFDAVFKANTRNVALLESRRDEPTAAERDRRALLGAAILLVGLLGATAIAVGAAAWWLVGEVGLV